MKLAFEDVAVDTPQPGEPVDFARMFGRDAPTEMELGTGKGGFLLDRARSMPQVNFLGVEWANKFYKFAADRMARWAMHNVRIMRADARHLMIHHVPSESLSALHVYHPDPWPKKRHHKRRLFQPAFVQAVARNLRPACPVYVQTDHEEYFGWIRDIVSQEPALLIESAGLVEDLCAESTPHTNYEIKYRREGRRFYSLVAVRR